MPKYFCYPHKKLSITPNDILLFYTIVIGSKYTIVVLFQMYVQLGKEAQDYSKRHRKQEFYLTINHDNIFLR